MKGLDDVRTLSGLRKADQTGSAWPTATGWTCLVSEALAAQDPSIIVSCGTALTRASDRVVLITLDHGGDVPWVGLFRDGRQVGEFNSAPAYFADDPSGDNLASPPQEPQAFASAPDVGGDVIGGLLPPPGSLRAGRPASPALGPCSRPARLFSRDGVPLHPDGESPVEWAKV